MRNFTIHAALLLAAVAIPGRAWADATPECNDADVNSTECGTGSSTLFTGATAVGTNSRALGEGSTSVGAPATHAYDDGPFSISAAAVFDFSSAFGSGTLAAGEYSTAIGSGARAGTALPLLADYVHGATALGARSWVKVGATNGTAVGFLAEVSGLNGAALGYLSEATGANSIALGTSSLSSGLSSSALGAQAVASGIASTALGHNSDATALASTAVGVSAQATQTGATAIGRLANAGHAGATAVGATSATTAANQVALGGSGSHVRVGDIAASTAAQQVGSVGIATVDANGVLGRDTSLLPALSSQSAAITSLQGDTVTLFDLTDGLRRDVHDANEGVAMALAMETPNIPAGARVAVSGGVGYFKDRAAFAAAISAAVGSMSSVSAGLGYGITSNEVGARAGFQLAW